MKRIFFIILFSICWLSPSLHAKNPGQQTKDSLLHLYLTSSPDTTRLKLLYSIALLDQISPTFIYYENKLLEEAVAQKNILFQSAAIYGHVVYYYNKLDQKHAEQWMHRLELIAEKNCFYNHYFKGKKMMIEFYIISQKIEQALKEAQDMYDKAEKLSNRNGMREACLCLSTGYFNTLRYKEGMAALNKAFELAEPDDTLLDKMDLLTKAVLAYSYLRDNDKLYHSLTDLDSIKRILAKTSGMTNGYLNLYLLIEIQYAFYYTRIQHPAEAWEHLQNSDKYLTTSSFLPYRLLRLGAYAEYYQLTKEYEKALNCLDEAIQLIAPISPEDAQIYGIQKADLLVKMKRPDEALPLYKQITKSKDSLYTAFSASQIEQIQSMYNMDKLIFQKEQRRTMFHRICLITFIIVIIVLLLFNIRMYSSRKHLERDEKEMRNLTRIAEEANEAKSRFLSNMSYSIRIPLNNVVGFSQLLSTDTNLSEAERNEYSEIIQTNSTELIQLVNDVLDLSRLEANMMKFQLQDCNVAEWCNDLKYTVQMHGGETVQLQLDAETGDARIHADINRLTQIVSGMLLSPDDCKEPYEARMSLVYQPEDNLITCRIENIPMANTQFTNQKVLTRQKINQLFFAHFGGTYKMEKNSNNKIEAITFTYPTLPEGKQPPHL